MVDENCLSEILCRLPAKTLLRCRCLSKSHLTLIGNSDFAKRQCICNRRSIKSDTCVLVTRPAASFRLNMYLPVEIIRPAANFRIDIDLDTSCSINVQPLIDPEKSLVVGCCRGVVCLRHVDDDDDRKKFTFWNPLTGQSSCFNDDEDEEQHCFFGHDLTTDDFKLLRISDDYGAAQIYSSKMRSWSSITPPRIPLVFASHVFVDVTNASHFFAKTYADILGFDFASQAFNLVPLPESGWNMSGLSSLDGCLCFLRNRVEDDCCDFWAMKGSWAKLFSIGLSVGQFVSNGNLVPLHFGAGQLILLCTCFLDGDRKHRLYAYDVCAKKLKKLLCGLHNQSLEHANYTGEPSDQKSFLLTPTLFRP